MTHETDLTNCDREPIHLLGAVQNFGFLLAISPDWIVLRASENIVNFLGRRVDDVVGRPLSDLFALDAIEAIRQRIRHLQTPDAFERLMRIALTNGGEPFDLAVHLSGQAIIIEGERSLEVLATVSDVVRNMTARLHGAKDIDMLCDLATRQMRELTGFDRVMVYRFAEDGAGQVIAEAKADNVPGYLGLHYPASDIPKQARALYERNWLRIIADVSDEGSAVIPQRGPDGAPLDLSMSVLRTVSPIHVEYLKNMGVGASLSVSILRQGKLWGLFACHHMVPRVLQLSTRTAAELFGQMFSWILESHENRAQLEAERRAREVHDRLMAGFAQEKGVEAMAHEIHRLRHLLPCDGVAIWIGDQVTLAGSTPPAEDIPALVRMLNTTAPSRVFAIDEIGRVHAPAKDFVEKAAGLLAIPISRVPRDYLLYFREEQIRKISWAGDPSKPVSTGPDGARLTPRKSFELWQETVRGRSAPWSPLDVRIAEQLRITLIEIILRMSDLAAEERQQAQSRQELLIAELNHRVRNILALIRGLVSQSSHQARDTAELTSVIGGRLQALARAHDQINHGDWGPGAVRSLIAAELEAYVGGGAERATLEGPDVLIEPQAFSALALVIHEMATNAAKYGALSVSHGRLAVSWRLHEGALSISWQESAGPPVVPPSRQGFGTTVIERTIPFELKGTARIAYDPDGVTGEFFIPAKFVLHRGGAPAPDAPTPPAPCPHEDGKFVGAALLVEDNLLIALDGKSMLEEMGFSEVFLAANLAEANDIASAKDLSAAVLDFELGDETTAELAERLSKDGIPCIFATGYGEALQLGTPSDIALIQKPFSVESLRRALIEAGAKRA
ncbi:MAG: GAF domain-containing protein [Proteobacteria bacterium]|nr:GAF domain-containing protein [Pseudomonadota bacterium]